MMALNDAGGSMCKARFALFEHRTTKSDLTTATSRQGLRFPLVCGNKVSRLCAGTKLGPFESKIRTD
jgi:hypothetical protein